MLSVDSQNNQLCFHAWFFKIVWLVSKMWHCEHCKTLNAISSAFYLWHWSTFWMCLVVLVLEEVKIGCPAWNQVTMSLLQMYKWTLAGMCCLVTPLCIPSWRSVYGCCKHIEKFAQVSCWALFSLVHKSWYSLPGSLIPKLHPRPVATLMAEGYFVLFLRVALIMKKITYRAFTGKGWPNQLAPRRYSVFGSILRLSSCCIVGWCKIRKSDLTVGDS